MGERNSDGGGGPGVSGHKGEGRSAAQAARLLDIAARIEAAVANRQPADATLAGIFRANRQLGSRDRRLLSGCVFAAWRWRGWCVPAPDLATVLLRAHAMECDGEAPPEALRHLAGDRADAAALLSAPAFQGLEDRRAWVSKHWKPDANISDLVPAWAAAALAIPPGVDKADWIERWIDALQRRPPLWLRAEDGDGEALARHLTAAGYPAAAHAGLGSAVRLDRRVPLAELERAVGPAFEVQDIASQAVVALCAPGPDEFWWDVCCGAGGKTLALAARIGARGRLFATDIRPGALREGRRRAARLGRDRIQWRQHDGRAPFPGNPQFDGVLIDAPCAGLGTWSRAPDARWRTEADDVESAAHLQRHLLDAAAKAVAPGGRLVYAVCSLTVAETSEIVSAFLERHPEFQLDAAPLPFAGGAPTAAWWIWPWMGPGTGMYAARLRRA